jgi:aspartate aminotransferase-like enzyme
LRKEYLMTPGPTPIPPEVLLTQAEPMVHHRTPQYTAIFVEVVEGLQRIFLTGNDVITLAASGTGGMEAAVANCFSRGDRVLVCVGGKFGERFGELCQAYGIQRQRGEVRQTGRLDGYVFPFVGHSYLLPCSASAVPGLQGCMPLIRSGGASCRPGRGHRSCSAE